MQVELKITATTQKEAAILASTAGFLADVMGGDDKPVSSIKTDKAPAVAAEPKASKGAGRPKKEKPAPVVEESDDEADELDDDLDSDAEDLDSDDDIELEDDEVEEKPAPKKAKAEKAPAEKKYSQKDIINGFKDYANSKGRDAGVALLKKYNVKSSREIKESDFPAFMKILSK